MANVINYAETYATDLDKMVRQKSVTGVLETSKVNWLGGRTFHVPTIETTGYKSHSRQGGFNRGGVTVDFEPYTLAFDRDIEFFVDAADVDETNKAASAANVTKQFNEEHAIPEVDAYRFAKLSAAATAAGNAAAEAITKENVYGRLKAAILPMRKFGPQNLVAFVSSEVMDALEQSTEFTRQITVNAAGAGVIESRVTAIDGVQIVEVWASERFYTEFDFTEGFVPTAEAKAINFLIVAKSAVVAKAKFDYIKLWAEGEHTQGHGWLYQNRLYHDLFVLKNQTDGVYLSHKA